MHPEYLFYFGLFVAAVIGLLAYKKGIIKFK
jgi:hypothetical protein